MLLARCGMWAISVVSLGCCTIGGEWQESPLPSEIPARASLPVPRTLFLYILQDAGLLGPDPDLPPPPALRPGRAWGLRARGFPGSAPPAGQRAFSSPPPPRPPPPRCHRPAATGPPAWVLYFQLIGAGEEGALILSKGGWPSVPHLSQTWLLASLLCEGQRGQEREITDLGLSFPKLYDIKSCRTTLRGLRELHGGQSWRTHPPPSPSVLHLIPQG